MVYIFVLVHLILNHLRIVFPTVAQNTSPATILAGFLEVLGRKIDNCEDTIELCQELVACFG